MKKIIILLAFISTMLTNAQMSDLTKLSSGKMEMFNLITELDGSIFGYFSISQIDQANETQNKFEYTLLDNSLNKVAGGEFLDANYNKYGNTFYAAEKINDKILISKAYYHEKSSYLRDYNYTSHRFLDLKTNTLSKPFYYDNEKFVDGERDGDNLSHILWKTKSTYEIVTANNNGFLMLEVAKKSKTPIIKTKRDLKFIRSFDEDKKEVWKYNYNPNGQLLDRRIQLLNDDNLVITTEDKKKNITFHSIDPKTGEKLFTYDFNERASGYSHDYYVQATENSIVIIGEISKYKISTGFEPLKTLGLFKIEISKTGKELSKKYFLWNSNQAQKILHTNNKGRIDKKYYLYTQRYVVFKNGTSAILTEKVRFRNSATTVNRNKDTDSDFVIMNFDKDFNLKNTDIIQKTASVFSKSRLFSQRLKDGDGVLFCFVNDISDDSYIGLITIIDGEMKMDKIPVNNDGFVTYPIKAKEGYILFREYNKSEETDVIRLERLNY